MTKWFVMQINNIKTSLLKREEFRCILLNTLVPPIKNHSYLIIKIPEYLMINKIQDFISILNIF